MTQQIVSINLSTDFLKCHEIFENVFFVNGLSRIDFALYSAIKIQKKKTLAFIYSMIMILNKWILLTVVFG